MDPATIALLGSLAVSLVGSLASSNKGKGEMSELLAYLKSLQSSPMAQGLNSTTLQAVLNQFGRTQGWGWPEGAQGKQLSSGDIGGMFPSSGTESMTPNIGFRFLQR